MVCCRRVFSYVVEGTDTGGEGRYLACRSAQRFCLVAEAGVVDGDSCRKGPQRSISGVFSFFLTGTGKV